ncbi:MAG: hypothetical protein ACI80K_002154 [Paracoccaceae bacterium]|jgi:hypothetical protein
MMTEKSGKTTRRSPSTPTPAREDARRAPSSVTGAVLLAGALLGGMTSCRVPAPTVQQGLQYGFNTPSQALESFRTAVQGNLLEEEFRCFSRQWKARTKVRSINYYSEARDELLSEIPQLRWALYRAEDPEVVVQRNRVALLQCRIPGPLWTKDRWLIFRMHREGYWDAWTEQTPEKPTEGNTFRDPVEANILQYVERYDVYRVNIDDFSEETGSTSPEAIIAVKGGWQWKIEDFLIADEPETSEGYEESTNASIPVSPAERE